MNARPALLAALAASLLLLSACAADFDLSGPGDVYIDEAGSRSDVQIMIRPENRPMRPLTAVLVPFRVMQRVDEPQHLGRELTRVLWQRWLQDKVFPALIFAEDAQWYTAEDAQPLAMVANTDLIVGGEITNIMFGGTQGETIISLRLEIHDAATGTLVWSMAQTGQIAPGRTRDFVFFTQHDRLPIAPVQAIMNALAADMGKPVRHWNNVEETDETDKESGKPEESAL
ncbi:hypothetical protein GGQ74_001242 [Desulfobaculum xiamenense]|uniref:ABC-type transport auxiliary lipoprotein component domain-containing protein n=1 Tax=Desulfobaculum xiamenense TaxID=995050 RepID=A0A846QMB8_9BACT|nr:hypothetical protein [Desulfobaculum xiamenense]NJB67602.1 hypothetical protein [Desulfobaculum xiamenense]